MSPNPFCFGLDNLSLVCRVDEFLGFSCLFPKQHISHEVVSVAAVFSSPVPETAVRRDDARASVYAAGATTTKASRPSSANSKKKQPMSTSARLLLAHDTLLVLSEP